MQDRTNRRVADRDTDVSCSEDESEPTTWISRSVTPTTGSVSAGNEAETRLGAAAPEAEKTTSSADRSTS